MYEELSCGINMGAGEISKVQNEIEATVKEVNVAVCKRAAKKTYATLLRELRDMVYAYVTDERVKISRNFATKDGPYSRSHVQLMQHHPAPAGTWFTRQPRSAKDSICSALYWRDAVVGSAVALELVESWYSTATFVFHTDLDWRHVGTALDRLPDVLKYGHFDMGYGVQKLIRKISLILLVHWNTSDRDDEILEGLIPLFRLRRGAAIHLVLNVKNVRGRVPSDSARLDVFLRSAFPSLVGLEKAGYRVSVANIPTEVIACGFFLSSAIQLGGRFGVEKQQILDKWLDRLKDAVQEANPAAEKSIAEVE